MLAALGGEAMVDARPTIDGFAAASQATGRAMRVEQRVEQPFADVDLAARQLADGLHELVAVHLALLQAAKDEHFHQPRHLSADGAVDGNTHSNALQLALLPSTFRRGVFAISPRVGVQTIRTIQTLEAGAPDWPYVGNVNTWRMLPAVGVDLTVALSDRWGIGMTYEPVLGRLGTAKDTGRYRQQFVGLDVVYARRK